MEAEKRKPRQKLQTLKALSYPTFCLVSSFRLDFLFIFRFYLRLEAVEEE